MLTLTDQALLRGWIEGLPVPTLGALYLSGAEPPVVRSRIAELCDGLATKARRCRRPDLAMPWRGKPEQRGHGEESETPDALEGRWMKQAHRSLEVLQSLPDPRPALDDPLDLWLTARSVRALGASGLVTLHDVQRAVLQGGRQWWRSLPRVGPNTGRAVIYLLRTEGMAPTADPTGEGPTRAEPPMTQAVQQTYRTYPSLNGANGENRAGAQRCLIAAANDNEAIQAWLGLWDPGSHTRRAYQREAERFLLWSVWVKAKAFSSLNVNDCKDYLDFLKAPDVHWTGNQAVRWSAEWKPFRGPLSTRSRRQTYTILRTLSAWLVDQHYLATNPFSGLPKRPEERYARIQTGRAFTVGQLKLLLEYCTSQGEESPARSAHYRRIGFVLRFAYATGLRLHELAQAKIGDLALDPHAPEPQWWLRVVGKGRKLREVPIQDAHLALISAELSARGLPPSDTCPSDTPLIGRLRRRAGGSEEANTFAELPLTPSGLHHLLYGFFREAGIALQASDPVAAARIARASAHWLRHSYGTHAVAQGVPLDVLQENLGHADLKTTSIYVRAEKDRRHAESRKHVNTTHLDDPVAVLAADASAGTISAFAIFGGASKEGSQKR